MTGSRVGILGGTFDPIHIGHLAAAEDAAWAMSLDRVLLVPNNLPPHKRDRGVSDTADRLAMVQAAVRDNPRFDVSLVEVNRSGPSYTLDTMRQLRAQLGPETTLFFLAGIDALADLHTWHEPDRLLAEFEVVFLCRPDARRLDWSLIEARFPGLRDRVALVDIPQLEISSSDIRNRVRTGQPIQYYVTAAVERYIRTRNLYREP